jgi:hypothetical protein
MRINEKKKIIVTSTTDQIPLMGQAQHKDDGCNFRTW